MDRSRLRKSSGPAEQLIARESQLWPTRHGQFDFHVGNAVWSGDRTTRSNTPPASSVAAAQQVLQNVERRENALRTALKRQKKVLKKLKKNAASHGATMKALKVDLKKVRKTRKSDSKKL